MSEIQEIVPLKTVEEVLNWIPGTDQLKFEKDKERSEYFLSGDSWNETNKSWEALLQVPLIKRGPNQPRTLVCHDMMGGYLQDRFINGCQEDGYHFRHWSQIDIFVYFSHHFVTIPPPGWVSAARVHGVQILGTIITEWDQGKQMLEQILSCDEMIQKFVSACVNIARFHGFHGWLLNIENPVRAELIPSLLKLVRTLTEAIKVGLGGPEAGGSVLWYDSVTNMGELKWQDELNSLNKPFFDVCDGIFLNYTWKTGDSCKGSPSTRKSPVPDNLANSIEALGNESRRADIFVGVDVFGRGCMGGGGFNCDQALREIKNHQLSVALFAPGWTYEIALRKFEEETKSKSVAENRCQLSVEKHFFVREHSFWGLLEPFLNFHGPNLQSLWSLQEGATDRELPAGKLGSTHRVFRSCFSLGRGPPSQDQPGWFDLKKMEFQPSLPVVANGGENNDFDGLGGECPRPLGEPPYFCFTTDDCSFNQSQCLTLGVYGKRTVPLLLCDLETGGHLSSLFVFVLKKEGKSVGNRNICQLKLGTDFGEEMTPRALTETELFMICSDWDLEPVGDKTGWEKLAFISNEKDHKMVQKIGLEIETSGAVFIGQFCIFTHNSERKGKITNAAGTEGAG